MEAMMSSSASSLKSFSCAEKIKGFRRINDDLLRTTILKSSLSFRHKNKNYKDPNLNLSLSVSSVSRVVRPNSLSPSNVKVEVEDTEVELEESHNKYTNDEAETVRVRFALQRRCSFGQRFLIVGEDPIFGSWDPKKAIPMNWSEGHMWNIDVDIPIGKIIKFKFILQVHKRKFTWQPGSDRIFKTRQTDKIITVLEDWKNAKSRKIIESGPTTSNQAEKSNASNEIAMQTTTNDTLNIVESKVKISENGHEDSMEPKRYATKLKKSSGSHDKVPVLIPSLDSFEETDIDGNGELENEALTMVSAGLEMAMDLKLPEVDKID